jgi:hypothetical protein
MFSYRRLSKNISPFCVFYRLVRRNIDGPLAIAISGLSIYNIYLNYNIFRRKMVRQCEIYYVYVDEKRPFPLKFSVSIMASS